MTESRASSRRIDAILLTLCIGSSLALGQSAVSPTPATASGAVDSAHTPQATSKSGNVEVLSDTQGVDFSSYLQDVLYKVRKNWYTQIPKEGETRKGKLAIEFVIQKDGAISTMKLVASSEYESLDRAAWSGITSSHPFPALPEAFRGPYLALRLRFDYNPDKSELDTDSSVPSASPVPALPLLHSQANSEASADSAVSNSSQPVLCTPPNAQTRVDGTEILSETHGVDLQPYLNDRVLPLIRANWYRLVSQSGEKAGGQATIQFTIVKNGSVTSLKLTDGAGHAALGDLAMNAVAKSGPFSALPMEFAGQSLDLQLQFEYAPRISHLPFDHVLRLGSPDQICKPDGKNAEGCVTPPRATYHPDPEYPTTARQNKTQGTVVVNLVVADDGTVQNACAAQALGDGLEEIAVQTVRTWKFEPATISGKAGAMQIAVEVDFHLYTNPMPAYDPSKDPAVPSATNSFTASVAVKVLPSAPAPNPGNTPSASQVVKPCLGNPSSHCITAPQLVSSPMPEISSNSSSSGTMTLGLRVTTEGKVENVHVLNSLGRELDKKALDAVSQWTFQPATKDGKPVPVEIVVEVSFKPNNNNN